MTPDEQLAKEIRNETTMKTAEDLAMKLGFHPASSRMPFSEVCLRIDEAIRKTKQDALKEAAEVAGAADNGNMIDIGCQKAKRAILFYAEKVEKGEA